MPWEPMPPVKPELPTRRAVFIDIEIFGGLSLGGDIISANWDGTTPLSLSSADSGATAGFALDSSAGAIQVQTIFAEGGEIGNLDIVNTLTLQTGGVIQTDTSGSRITISKTDKDRIRLFTGDSFEAVDIGAVLRPSAIGTDGTTRQLTLTAFSPPTTGDTVGTSIDIRSESEDDSSFPPQVVLSYGGGSTQIPEFKLQSNFKLMLEDGTAALPSLTFNTDTNTGIYHQAADAVGIVAGGTHGIKIANATIKAIVNTTGSLNIVHNAAGTASAPTYAFRGDANTGMYRTSADIVSLAAGGVEGIRYNNITAGTALRTSTTGSSANLSSGSAFAEIQRNTSARKYKSCINYNIQLMLADIELRPAKFYRKDDKAWYLGFIADDLADQHKLIGEYSDGEIENYDLRAVVAVLAAKVNRLEALMLEQV